MLFVGLVWEGEVGGCLHGNRIAGFGVINQAQVVLCFFFSSLKILWSENFVVWGVFLLKGLKPVARRNRLWADLMPRKVLGKDFLGDAILCGQLLSWIIYFCLGLFNG